MSSRKREVVKPSEYNADCNDDLDELVIHALSKDLSKRFTNAEEFLDSLNSLSLKKRKDAPKVEDEQETDAKPGPSIFVSYSHANKEIVKEEVEVLRKLNCSPWFDEGIEPGGVWTEYVANAVIESDIFLFYVSRDSVKSEHCRNEINLALNRKKKFIAVYLEDTHLPPGLELRISELQAIFKYKTETSHYREKIGSLIGNSVK